MAKKKRKKKVEAEESTFSEHILDFSLGSRARRIITIIFFILLAILSALGLFDLAGALGAMLKTMLLVLFGYLAYGVPPFLVIWSILLMNKDGAKVRGIQYLGIGTFLLSLSGILLLPFDATEIVSIALAGKGGGVMGLIFGYPLIVYTGFMAAMIILVGLFIVSLILISEQWFVRFFEIEWLQSVAFKVNNFFSRDDNEEEGEWEDEDDWNEDEVEEDEEDVDDESQEVSDTEEKPSKPKRTYSRSKARLALPLSLLNEIKDKPTSGDIFENKERIQNCLGNFNIDVEMGDSQVGPTVTQYTMKPAEGVKLSRIVGLHNDLALALAAHPIRIEAPIPGKSLIGIEVPNKDIARVGLRGLINSPEFKKNESRLTIALGRKVDGTTHVAGLDKMPHLLVAGATGSGKSVFVNALIISLIYQNTPDMLRFVFVDPKRVELMMYNHIPHLLTPVITDVKKTVNALRWLLKEMDRRYTLLAEVGKRNIASYNASSEDPLPYIVVVIDELADLMVVASSEVESAIIRLAQMARAIGIHLVLATQRPSVDVITGLIKANIPARVAFAVTSLTDSRTILDSSGAEKLIGKGDMLFTSADTSKPMRMQGALTTDEEIKRIVSYLKEEMGLPDYVEDVVEKQSGGGSSGFDFGGSNSDDPDDDLYEEAKETVMQAGKASASYLQRKLRVGYARAARLIDLLEDNGIVGPAEGSKPRDVLVVAEEDFDEEADEYDDSDEYEEDDE